MTLNLLVSSNMRRLMINNVATTASSHQLGSLVLTQLFEDLSRRSSAGLTMLNHRLNLSTTNARFLNVNRKAYFAVRSQIIKALNSQKKDVVRIDQKSLTLKPGASQQQSSKQPSTSSETAAAAKTTTETASIFKRFKEAYKQHGMVLIATHMVTSVGWITGLFMLSKGGFHITSLFNVLEKFHIMSAETSTSIVTKIDNFNLEEFLRHSYLDYVLNDSAIKWLGASITGDTLKNMITAVLLYKLFTPLRYLVTLAGTNIVIRLFKRRGVIPAHPPAGSSIRELYTEQKHVLRRSLKMQREKYRKRFRNTPKR